MHLPESFKCPDGQVPYVFLVRLILRECTLPLVMGAPAMLALLEALPQVVKREAARWLHTEAVT